MSRYAVFFLLVISTGLAILLGVLGFETLPANLMGWFLLLVGVSYTAGIIIVVWIQKNQFWKQKLSQPAAVEEKNDLSFWLIIPGFLVGFFAPPAEFLFLSAWLPREQWIQWVGLVLVIIGSLLFLWSRRTAKNVFTGHLSVSSDQILIQNCPYSRIRHPGYASYLLMVLGVCLGYSSWIGLTGLGVLLIPGLVYRIKVEESLLEKHFGQQFQEYARRTKRLIPWIW